MLLIESALVLLALVIAVFRPTLGSPWFEKIECNFSRLARRRGLAVVAVGIAALGLRAGLLPVLPVPEPIVHDEFGYLLAADTFAHGRLTNPTHPLWEHFETFHVIFHPSYASIYPPAQGLILAAGKIITGKPFWGVWFSVGAMCASITWMLQAWMSPEWAFLGGVLAILRYGVFSYWADSYWGGAVATIGGALVLGALPRIKSLQRQRDVLLMGLGVAILANSRPYEGFIFCLPIAFLLLAWMSDNDRPPYKVLLRRIVLPLALCLSFTAAGTGYYFWRLNGTPFLMPYQIERRNYAVAPYMIWQSVRPEPVYHHAAMRKMFVEEEMLGLKTFRSPVGVLLRVYLFWNFFLGPVLTLPFIMLVLALPRDFSFRNINRSTGVLLSVLTVFTAGSLLVNFYSPHYSAPVTGLIVAIILLSMRELRRWGGRGLFLTRAVVVICLFSFALRAAASPLHIPLHEFYEFAWYQKNQRGFGRALLLQKLERFPGKQLVIVRYRCDHEPFAEWVYNDADIDQSKVVWARDMGKEQNRELLNYFKERKSWLLAADDNPPKLDPYPTTASDMHSAQVHESLSGKVER